jgi:CIC family chloride channel protein
MLGGAVGTVERLFFPHLTGTVGTYALVGMGVLFAGFLRAPITSVFMALEVSGDYSIILPVLVANTFSYLISRRLQAVPALELITRQDGLYLPAMEEEREQEILSVEDAMRPVPAVILDGRKTAGEVWPSVQDSAEHYFLTTRPNVPVAIVSKIALKKLVDSGDQRALTETQVLDTAPQLYPDENLEDALRLATSLPLVPVLSRADSSRILGVIDLADIMEAYRRSKRQDPSQE